MEDNNKLKKILSVVIAIVVFAALVWLGSGRIASYYYKKGIEAYSQNNFAAAKSNLEKSLIFDYYANPQTYYFLGKISLGAPTPEQVVYHANANYGEAAGYFEKAISLGLEKENRNLYSTALDNLGNAYWQLENFEKAREKYLEKLSKFPESSFWARLRIASDDFNRLNKPEEALEVLLPAQGLTKSENDLNHIFRVYFILARLYVYFGDYNSAERYAKLALESVTEKNKKDWEIPIAHVIIALNYGRQKKFDLATSEINKADEIRESKGAYNCFLASAFYRGVNYSKAISTAEKVLETDNEFKVYCIAILANSYMAQGATVKAKKYFQDYLNITENFAEKNIVILRNRKQFAEELERLK